MRGDWGKGLGKRIYPECTSGETQLSGLQLGGGEACSRPHLPSGEQLGGVGACFCPQNHHLRDMKDMISICDAANTFYAK